MNGLCGMFNLNSRKLFRANVASLDAVGFFLKCIEQVIVNDTVCTL